MLKERMENVKGAASLEWLIWHKYMGYMGSHDDPCDIAILVSMSPRKTR